MREWNKAQKAVYMQPWLYAAASRIKSPGIGLFAPDRVALNDLHRFSSKKWPQQRVMNNETEDSERFIDFAAVEVCRA